MEILAEIETQSDYVASYYVHTGRVSLSYRINHFFLRLIFVEDDGSEANSARSDLDAGERPKQKRIKCRLLLFSSV